MIPKKSHFNYKLNSILTLTNQGTYFKILILGLLQEQNIKVKPYSNIFEIHNICRNQYEINP